MFPLWMPAIFCSPFRAMLRRCRGTWCRHHHRHCRHGASCPVPVSLCRLIRLAAGADYNTIVTRPLFSPAWLSAHSLQNLFQLSQETPEGGVWFEMWTHVPLSDLNKLYFCLQLITSEGSTKMGSHFKWNGALWELLIECAVYCLCRQLWQKRFVPAFIWDFQGEKKVCLCV